MCGYYLLTNKMSFTDLHINDWKKLEKLGLVIPNEKGKHGYGFSNTTKFADDNLLISSIWTTYLKIGNQIYSVFYSDGCIYPIWSCPDLKWVNNELHIDSKKNKLDLFFELNHKGEIVKWDGILKNEL